MQKKTHGKSILCRMLFVWHTANYWLCRVPKKRHTAKHGFAVCQKNHTTKYGFAVCFFKPGVFVMAHGKVAFCRVLDRKHTGNNETHGKYGFSRSVPPTLFSICTSTSRHLTRQTELPTNGRASYSPEGCYWWEINELNTIQGKRLVCEYVII